MLTPTPAAPSGELLPCPFCGATATTQRFGNRDGSTAHAVWCDLCHVSTPWTHGGDGEQRAIEAWNRRAAVSQAAPEQATPIAAAIEADAAAFEATLSYKPERIPSTKPLGWQYGWRDTQEAFRKFCNTPRALAAPSGAPKQEKAVHQVKLRIADFWQDVTDEEAARTVNGPAGDQYERRTVYLAAASTVQSAPVLPGAPKGMALVPIIPTHAMQEVMEEEDWQWGDLLAAAESITEAEYEVCGMAAQSTPVQVEGQQEQALQPSCDSALHAEPAGQHDDGWPGEIYLDAGDDPLAHFSEYADVSWCDHPQGESDVRYVRADIGELVNRFLGWPLPVGLCPNVERPIGTHLLNADQAREMFEYVLASRCRAQGGIDDPNGAVQAVALPVAAAPDDMHVAFNPNEKCSPTLTQCPRCNNPHNACDQTFGAAAPEQKGQK